MDFTFLRSRRVYAALKDHPDLPSLKTVERWTSGKSRPPQWAVEAMRERLLGTQKAPAQPPDWAAELANETANKVIEALKLPADVQAAAALMIERREGRLPPPLGAAGDPAGRTAQDAPAPPGLEPG